MVKQHCMLTEINLLLTPLPHLPVAPNNVTHVSYPESLLRSAALGFLANPDLLAMAVRLQHF